MKIEKFIFEPLKEDPDNISETLFGQDPETAESLNELANGTLVDEDSPPPPTEEELAAIEQQEQQKRIDESFQRGIEEGRNQALQEKEAEITALKQDYAEKEQSTLQTLCDTIAAKLDTVESIHTHYYATLEQDLIALVQAIATKLTGEIENEALFTNLTSIVEKSLQLLCNEPKINIMVAETLKPSLEELISDSMKKTGFTGKVFLKSKDDLAEGDCEIEWEDGKMEYSREAVWEEINQLLASYSLSSSS